MRILNSVYTNYKSRSLLGSAGAKAGRGHRVGSIVEFIRHAYVDSSTAYIFNYRNRSQDALKIQSSKREGSFEVSAWFEHVLARQQAPRSCSRRLEASCGAQSRAKFLNQLPRLSSHVPDFFRWIQGEVLLGDHASWRHAAIAAGKCALAFP